MFTSADQVLSDNTLGLTRWQFSSVQSLSRVWLFATPWTAACQSSLSITNSWNLFKLMFIESVMPSNQLILCCPLLLLLSIFPRIRVFSSESALHIRWPKYWTSASASVRSMNIQGSFRISFRIDLFGLLAVQELSRVFSSTTVQKYQFFSALQCLLYGPTLTSIHDFWKNHSFD